MLPWTPAFAGAAYHRAGAGLIELDRIESLIASIAVDGTQLARISIKL
jgi:hypothetical protein